MSDVLVVGTNNRHKLSEIGPYLDGLNLELKLAATFGPFDPDENGSTLEENALIKARAAMELSGQWSIADDTGLEVDALDGRPGIHAARYAGEACNFEDNIRKLLGELSGVPDERRTAQFVCVIALCRPGCEPLTVRGCCDGRILNERRGSGGFGYDPVFGIDALGKSFAELTRDEKNRISHRGRAVRLIREKLVELLPNAAASR